MLENNAHATHILVTRDKHFVLVVGAVGGNVLKMFRLEEKAGNGAAWALCAKVESLEEPFELEIAIGLSSPQQSSS